MSEDQEPTQPRPPKTRRTNTLAHPEVLTALITGVVTLLVVVLTILPSIVKRPEPTRTPTFTPTITFTAVFTATDTSAPLPTAMPSDTPTPTEAAHIDAPTETAVASSTSIPTATATRTLEPTADSPTTTRLPLLITPPTLSDEGVSTVEPSAANLKLIFDDVSFSVLNLSDETISLEGVVFRSDGKEWEARDWGVRVHDRLPADNCLRMRDFSAGPRTPPAECGNLYGLMEVGAPALFWLDVEAFEVMQDGISVAVCPVGEGMCYVTLPEK